MATKEMLRKYLWDFVGLTGLTLFVGGLSWVWLPLGPIVLGFFLMIVAVTMVRK